ncbi:MAG: PH domain-containing protein [Clostridia bacterium]|nr:PH domain-containing protein [Clostridia bacterium]
MGKYVEKHLQQNEYVVERARRDAWGLFGWWILGILFCWLLFIPLIKAIKETVIFSKTELVLTNRRIIRKSGVFHRQVFESPLSKIQGVYLNSTFLGRVFNVTTIRIITMNGIIVERIADGDDFKGAILGETNGIGALGAYVQKSTTA